jgi:hypothetical protein
MFESDNEDVFMSASMPLQQATQPTIAIMGEEDPIEIGFEAVSAYHGQAALAMLAVTFQAIRTALIALSPDAAPKRGDMTIVSGHPGPGVRDAFEFVTRAVTRGVYTVDRSLPNARLVPGYDISYSFRITVNGKTIEMALLPNALPERFFTLNFNPSRTAADEAELSRLKKTIATSVLAASPDALFSSRMY